MSARFFQYLKTNKKSLIIGTILNLVVLYYLWLLLFSGDFLATHSQNAKNREILLEIRDSIQIEDDYENVLQKYWSNTEKCNGLKINTNRANSWSISMPLELFTTNWGFFINFQNGKVSGYGIRNADGLKPKDAPEDVGKTDE